MSTIQNLKNFIRHGKQARNVDQPRDQPTTNVSPVHAHNQQTQRNHHADAAGDPYGNQGHQAANDQFAASVDQQGIASRAGHAVASVAAIGQKIHHNARAADLQKIVDEEKDQRNKMPKYPGLERYVLLEKMGDGAFSNVYRARDTQGQTEVAIKVVRKFEMSANQV